MKRYPIGTRVRIGATNDAFKALVGKEAVITAYAPEVYQDGYVIDIIGVAPPHGTAGYSARHCPPEPTLNNYDGHETTTWAQCPWRPEGVKV